MIQEILGCEFCWQSDPTMFWACKGVLLGDVVQQGTTIDAGAYCMTVEGLRAAIK
jgi:hypothetical protein